MGGGGEVEGERQDRKIKLNLFLPFCLLAKIHNKFHTSYAYIIEH